MSSAKRIASRYLQAAEEPEMTGQGTLRSNRQRILEFDERLAREYRDGVVEHMRRHLTSLTPNHSYPPQSWMDGDRKLYIDVTSKAGVNPPLLFEVQLPEDPFYQFAFGMATIKISELKRQGSVEAPDMAGDIGGPDKAAQALLKAIRGYIEGGWQDAPGTNMSLTPGAFE